MIGPVNSMSLVVDACVSGGVLHCKGRELVLSTPQRLLAQV